MLYVLNEWVFHDLLGENGGDAFKKTAEFLTSFDRSTDKLVIPTEERWTQKAYLLMRMTDVRGRQVSKIFRSLLLNSDRAVRLTPEDLPQIAQELQDQAPPEDLYLVLAYVATNADHLITTDEKLHSALDQHDEVNCRLRDEFLTSYTAGEFR